jgi:hypothetical protein
MHCTRVNSFICVTSVLSLALVYSLFTAVQDKSASVRKLALPVSHYVEVCEKWQGGRQLFSL